MLVVIIIEPAASQAHEAQVPSVSPILAATVPTSDYLRAEQAQPPERQKDGQEQAIQPGEVLQLAGFEIPAPTFAILEGRFQCASGDWAPSGPDLDTGHRYAEAGVTRCLFSLPSAGREEIEPLLEEYAAVAAEVVGCRVPALAGGSL